MAADFLIPILVPILPSLLLILGGQYILNQYEARKQNKAQAASILIGAFSNKYEKDN